MNERCEHAARSNLWARASKLWGMKSGKGERVRCTKPRREVGGVPEELNNETTVLRSRAVKLAKNTIIHPSVSPKSRIRNLQFRKRLSSSSTPRNHSSRRTCIIPLRRTNKTHKGRQILFLGRSEAIGGQCASLPGHSTLGSSFYLRLLPALPLLGLEAPSTASADVRGGQANPNGLGSWFASTVSTRTYEESLQAVLWFGQPKSCTSVASSHFTCSSHGPCL